MKRTRSFYTLREVWSAVTATPNASIQELATRLHYSVDTISVSLRRLRDLGYIEAEPRQYRARRVIVPFIDTFGGRR